MLSLVNSLEDFTEDLGDADMVFFESSLGKVFEILLAKLNVFACTFNFELLVNLFGTFNEFFHFVKFSLHLIMQLVRDEELNLFDNVFDLFKFTKFIAETLTILLNLFSELLG